MLPSRFGARGKSHGPLSRLSRGSMSRSPMLRGMEAEDEAPPETSSSGRAYTNRQPFSDVAPLKSQTPKLAKDCLFDLLRDRNYHSAVELEQAMPHGAWVTGLRELLAQGYAFDKVDNHIKMRLKGDTELRQVLVEVLAGLDASGGANTFLPPSLAPKVVHEEPSDDFDPTVDERPDVDGPTGKTAKAVRCLVLSTPPEDLTLLASESISMTAAILAKKNSGKTYLAMVEAEEMLAVEDPPVALVVIDPTGVWFGLRSMADGLPSPFAILSLGGRHGDLPITAQDGKRAATIVNEIRPHPVILDLSSLAPTEQHEFVADFVETIFTTAERSPIHIIIDEADEFAPQTLNASSRHQKRSLDALDRLVRRGRSKGIGVTMITQRSAVIAKNVLSQIDSLWLLNMVDPRDLLAVEDRLKHGVMPQQRIECLNQIPRLQPGFAYFLQTGMSPKFRRFKVRRKKTFDSSKTPGELGYAEPILAKPLPEALAIAEGILQNADDDADEVETED